MGLVPSAGTDSVPQSRLRLPHRAEPGGARFHAIFPDRGAAEPVPSAAHNWRTFPLRTPAGSRAAPREFSFWAFDLRSLRSGSHTRGLAEASRRDRQVAALSPLQRFALLSRRATDVGTGGKVERRDQPVALSSTDRQLYARGRGREVRARVFVPGLLAYVAIGCVEHSACAGPAARLANVAPARPRRRRDGPRRGATREGNQHERQRDQGFRASAPAV